MRLYIARHGIAQPRGANGVRSDEERELTPKGRRRVQGVAGGLRVLGCRPGRIGTSPLARAEQTARTMAEILCPDAPLEVCDFLAPEGNGAEGIAWLKAHRDDNEVMVVGHLPGVAQMASEMLLGTGCLDMIFKKAAVCCLRFEPEPEPGEGRVEWLLQPRQLRLLGEGGTS